jgi:hypothetical protein
LGAKGRCQIVHGCVDLIGGHRGRQERLLRAPRSGAASPAARVQGPWLGAVARYVKAYVIEPRS